MWSGGVRIGVASVRDRWSVELVDLKDVVRANCGNELGGAGKCNGCAIVVGVGSMLGASVVAGVGRSGVLGETFDLHCRCRKIFECLRRRRLRCGRGWFVGWRICLIVVLLTGQR